MAVLLAALGLRLTGLGVGDFWLDELHSLADSAGRRAEMEAVPQGVIFNEYPDYTEMTPDSTLGAVWRTMSHDSHPPTYFMLLWGWRHLVGDTPFAVRALSVIFSVLAFVPLFLVFRDYGRPRTGLWAAALLAVAYVDIRMSQHARPYTLSMCLVLISFWLLVRMETRWAQFSRQQKLLWPTLYGIITVLCMLTHYFAGVALLGQALYAGLCFRGQLRRAFIGSAFAGAVLFGVIWLPTFLDQQRFIAEQPWLLEARADHPVRTMYRAADLPVRLLVQSFQSSDREYYTSPLRSVVGLAILLGALGVVWRYRCRGAWLFAFGYLVVPVLFGAIDLGTGKQLLSHVRYSYVALPGLIGLLVLAAEQLPRLVGRLTLGGLILAALVSLELPTGTKPHAKRAAQLVQQVAGPEDLIIYDACGWPVHWAARLYAVIAYHLEGPGYPTLLLRDPPSPALKRQIRNYRRIVVVCPRDKQPPDPAPETHHRQGVSPYIPHIGWVYLFSATPEENAAP